MRITIPVAALEFEEGGSTIWIHSPKGGTVLRIKTTGVIKTERCNVSPISHGDIIVPKDIVVCLSDDSNNSSNGS